MINKIQGRLQSKTNGEGFNPRRMEKGETAGVIEADVWGEKNYCCSQVGRPCGGRSFATCIPFEMERYYFSVKRNLQLLRDFHVQFIFGLLFFFYTRFLLIFPLNLAVAE